MITVLSEEDGNSLLLVAQTAIAHGFSKKGHLFVDPAQHTDALRRFGASFVSLFLKQADEEKLRGCVGSLSATQPLVVDVARRAHDAAFSDPRFPPLLTSQLSRLYIKLSVLSPLYALTFRDENSLLEQLLPNEHGLVIDINGKRSTFLPEMWHHFPDAVAFLAALKLKHKASERHAQLQSSTEETSDCTIQRAWSYRVASHEGYYQNGE